MILLYKINCEKLIIYISINIGKFFIKNKIENIHLNIIYLLIYNEK